MYHLQDKNDKLVCPADSKKEDLGAGYISLANDVTAFDNAECLAKTLSMSWINDGDGVEATLEYHRVKFHKSCRLQYSKSRLERVTKRKNTEAESSTACVEKKPRREQVSRKLNKSKDSLLCLFCEKPASASLSFLTAYFVVKRKH